MHARSEPDVPTVVKPLPRLRLQGFNNLTKALSFNIYDICYAVSEEQRQRYIEYIDEEYNADRLTQILTDVAAHHRRQHPERRAPGLRSAGRLGDHPDLRGAGDRQEGRPARS